MKSLWSDAEAATYQALSGCAFTLRACSAATRRWSCTEVATPVKLREKNLFGEDEDVLYVKGSGWDLETIEAAGFTPVTLSYVRRLAALERLPDPQMVNELNTHMLRAGAPSPSVETILHAILPHTCGPHARRRGARGLNAPEGDKRIREIYGDRVVVIPYIMAGFDLATYCARVSQAGGKEHDRHGAALARHLLVCRGRARVVRAHDRARLDGRGIPAEEKGLARSRSEDGAIASQREDIASLRRAMSDQAGFR